MPTSGLGGLTCVVRTPNWVWWSKPSRQRVQFSETRNFADFSFPPKDVMSTHSVPKSSIHFRIFSTYTVSIGHSFSSSTTAEDTDFTIYSAFRLITKEAGLPVWTVALKKLDCTGGIFPLAAFITSKFFTEAVIEVTLFLGWETPLTTSTANSDSLTDVMKLQPSAVVSSDSASTLAMLLELQHVAKWHLFTAFPTRYIPSWTILFISCCEFNPKEVTGFYVFGVVIAFGSIVVWLVSIDPVRYFLTMNRVGRFLFNPEALSRTWRMMGRAARYWKNSSCFCKLEAI